MFGKFAKFALEIMYGEILQLSKEFMERKLLQYKTKQIPKNDIWYLGLFLSSFCLMMTLQ